MLKVILINQPCYTKNFRFKEREKQTEAEIFNKK